MGTTANVKMRTSQSCCQVSFYEPYQVNCVIGVSITCTETGHFDKTIKTNHMYKTK